MRGNDLKIGNILGIDFFMIGRNKSVRALAKTGVSGDHRANVPETPPRAKLGWSYSCLQLSAALLVILK